MNTGVIPFSIPNEVLFTLGQFLKWQIDINPRFGTTLNQESEIRCPLLRPKRRTRPLTDG